MPGKQLDPKVCNVKVAAGAVVCVESDYLGDITIGTRTVVHPKAKILAEAGPIIFGTGNLIEEQAEIINRYAEGDDTSTPKILAIGNNNVFEVGSKCHAYRIGDYNVLEAKSVIGPGIELTSGCIISPLCEIKCSQVIPPNTVIQGNDYSRRVQTDRPAAQGLQLDFLIKILPNYHTLVKPVKKV